jgi:ATP-dependent RNA helicase DDX31/DBP7
MKQKPGLAVTRQRSASDAVPLHEQAAACASTNESTPTSNPYAALIQQMTANNFARDVFGEQRGNAKPAVADVDHDKTHDDASEAIPISDVVVAPHSAPAPVAAKAPTPKAISQISRRTVTKQNSEASTASSLSKIFGVATASNITAPKSGDDLQKAANTPAAVSEPVLEEVKLADLLHPKLLRSITEKMKIERLTRVQQLAWGPMLQPELDVLVRSETGSGKTFAYMGPTLHRLLTDCDTNKIDRTAGTLVIVMAPTRELVEQVAQVTSVMLQNAQFITVGSIHGGDNRHKEKARLRKGIHILVATPGRLLDHLCTTSSFEHSKLQTLILDEADRLLDMGFEKAIRSIMEVITPKKRVLVSATITDAVQRLSHFALKDPVQVGETEDTFQVPASLRQHFALVPPKHRLAALISFLRCQLDAGSNRIVVFVSTSDSAEFHYSLLSRLRNPFSSRKRVYNVNRTEAVQRPARKSFKKMTSMANRHLEDGEDPEDVVTFEDDELSDQDEAEQQLDDTNSFLPYVNVFKLHGNMSQVDRASVFHAFKHGKSSNHTLDDDAGSGKPANKQAILVCTDVASRGLDMPHIDWITHYDPPTDERCYVHRVGRTARIGRVGDSMLFLMPHEAQYAEYLSKFIAMPIEEKKFEVLLYYLTKLDPSSHHNWMQSTAVLERGIASAIRDDKDGLGKVCRFAYQSYMRAYSGYPRPVRQFFNVDMLHLGHIAHSFGLDEKPSELRKTLRVLVKDERKLSRDTSRFKQGERMEMDTKELYHSTLVNKGLKQSRDYHEHKRATIARVAKPLEFTEFDA